MNRKILARVSAGVLFLLLASVAYMQSQNQPPKLTLNKVKDDLYEIEGDGGNVGVYITSEGVILVDDKYDQDHEGILAAVKQVTPLAGEIRDQHASSRGSQRRQHQDVQQRRGDHFDRHGAEEHRGEEAGQCASGDDAGADRVQR